MGRLIKFRKRRSVGRRFRDVCKVTPYRYQIKGVRFLQETGGRALVADDMGLGKTLQALGWLAINPTARPAFIVCPSSVKYNWQAELKNKFGLDSNVIEGKSIFHCRCKNHVRPGKSRRCGKCRSKIQRRSLEGEIFIINWHILAAWVPVIVDCEPSALIMDECHYAKSQKAGRTKAARTISRVCDHVIALSGTPIVNRPAEFFPILNMIAPDRFSSYWDFGFRYCAPKQGWGGSWEFKGQSHLDELRQEVEDLMIRRMKTEVLKDLPIKQRSVIPVEIDNSQEYKIAERNFAQWLVSTEGKEALKKALPALMLVRLGKLKKLAAKGKIKAVCDWIDDFLEESEGKLVVFAVHKEIVKILTSRYKGSAVIVGGVSGEKRQAIVERFQSDPKQRIFIGNLKAAGTGITLTASSTVLFTEFGWTPAEHDQAEDRVLRIGQKATSVNAYYIVGKSTLEEDILSILDQKRQIVTRVLDGEERSGRALFWDLLEGRYNVTK